MFINHFGNIAKNAPLILCILPSLYIIVNLNFQSKVALKALGLEIYMFIAPRSCASVITISCSFAYLTAVLKPLVFYPHVSLLY